MPLKNFNCKIFDGASSSHNKIISTLDHPNYTNMKIPAFLPQKSSGIKPSSLLLIKTSSSESLRHGIIYLSEDHIKIKFL